MDFPFSSLGARVKLTGIKSLILRGLLLTGQYTVVSGFGKMILFGSGVMTGTQKLGNSFALSPSMFDNLLLLPLDDGLLSVMPTPFSVAAQENSLTTMI